MSESLPQSRLSEEELKEWVKEPRHLPNVVSDYRIKRLIVAYRSLISANEELRTDRDIALQAAENAMKQTVELSDRVTELEAVLDWYADAETYREVYQQTGLMKYVSEIKSDKGERARQALKGAEPNEHNPL